MCVIVATSMFKALAKWTRKSTQADASFWLARSDLRLVWPATFMDLRWLWWSSNSYASRRKFVTVWPPNTSRHSLIASQLYQRAFRLAWTCEPTCKSVWPPIASPYASSCFANLYRLASTYKSVWPGLKMPTFVVNAHFSCEFRHCSNFCFTSYLTELYSEFR